MSKSQLSVSQILILTIGVPLFALGMLEVACRILNLPSRISGEPDTVALEMPTWMLREEGSKQKAVQLAASKQEVDWLDIFEESPGIRVHLVPGLERRVTNTFSRIAADREARYLVKANSLGFRGPDPVSPKPANGFRVVIFGDSSSFGWGVNQDETYAAVLERDLQVRHPERKIEVLNFAIPGDSSEYGRLIFEKYAKDLEPDLVILGFGANDAKAVPLPHKKQVDSFRSQEGIQSVRQTLEWSALVRTIKAIIQKASAVSAGEKQPGNGKKKNAVRYKRYRDNLLAMASGSEKLGASAAMLVAICTPGDYAQVANHLADDQDFLFFNGQQYLISRLPEIKNHKLYPEMVQQMESRYPQDLAISELNYISSDGCHPNALGHRLIGEKISLIIDATLKQSSAD